MENITIVLRKQIVDLSAKDADQLTVEQAVFVHAEYAEVSDGGFIEFLPAGCEGNHQTIISASGHGFSCSGIPVTAVYDRVEFWPSEYAKAEFPSHLEYEFGKRAEDSGRFGYKDLTGVTEINFDKLKSGVGILVADFVEAVSLLKRPYFPISDAQYDLVSEMTRKAKTDFLLTDEGLLVTFGNADGGYALMPINPATQDGEDAYKFNGLSSEIKF